MRNILFRLFLFSVLFQGSICFGEEWFYGTWYFDRDFTSNQIENVIATVDIPKPDKEYLSEFIHSGEAFKELDTTTYVISSTNITFTVDQKVFKDPYKILERPYE